MESNKESMEQEKIQKWAMRLAKALCGAEKISLDEMKKLYVEDPVLFYKIKDLIDELEQIKDESDGR